MRSTISPCSLSAVRRVAFVMKSGRVVQFNPRSKP
jgi:hypothetical protein